MKILSVGRGEVSEEAWRADIKGMLDAKFKNGYDQKCLNASSNVIITMQIHQPILMLL